MATVTFLNESYECSVALKGANYIHLLDANGGMIASFDGVTDFSGFAISGGSWTTPSSDDECNLAVIRADGTIGKGGHKCSDISGKAIRAHYTGTLTASGWSSSAPYTQTVSISGILAADTPVIDLNMSSATASNAADLQAAWACVGRIVTAANTITAYCYEEKPTVNLPLNILVVR